MKNISIFFVCFFLFLLKFVSQPTLAWAKNIGSGNDMGYSITVDASNNIYTTGYFTGTADFDPGPGIFTLTSNGGQDIFISKIDQSGNFVWAKSNGSFSNDIGSSISVNSLGEVYISGYFSGPLDLDPGIGTNTVNFIGSTDFFVLKLSPSGNFNWGYGFGDTGNDFAHSTAIDGSGNLIIGGYFTGTVDFDPSAGINSISTTSFSADAYILNLSSSGTFNWVKSFGGDNTDRIFSVAIDQIGNIYSTGQFYGVGDFDPSGGTYTLSTFGNQSDPFITKFDPSGNFIWAKNFIGPSFDYGSCITVDASGNVYTTGSFGGTTDFDPGVGTFTLNATSSQCCFISKLDPSGNFIWAKSMNNNGPGLALSLNALGQLYIGATFTGTIDLDPGVSTQTVLSAGLADIFLLKIDQTGNLLWAGVISGTGDDNIRSITIDQAGNICSTGGFYGVSDFDPGVGIYNMTYTVGGSVFVQKLNPQPAGIFNKTLESQSNFLYPNPSNGLFTFNSTLSCSEYHITDNTGRVIFTQKEQNEVSQINICELPSGVYHLIVHSKESNTVFKIIKSK